MNARCGVLMSSGKRTRMPLTAESVASPSAQNEDIGMRMVCIHWVTAGIEGGSGEPNKVKKGTVTHKQVRDIAEFKLKDMNAFDIDQAAKSIAGTARSMGLDVVD